MIDKPIRVGLIGLNLGMHWAATDLRDLPMIWVTKHIRIGYDGRGCEPVPVKVDKPAQLAWYGFGALALHEPHNKSAYLIPDAVLAISLRSQFAMMRPDAKSKKCTSISNPSISEDPSMALLRWSSWISRWLCLTQCFSFSPRSPATE